MRNLLWNLSQGGILVLSGVAIYAAWRAAAGWLHDGRRFNLVFLGTGAVLFGAVVAVTDYRMGPAPGLLSWLRLPAAVALPILFIMLLRALRRRDALAREVARDAHFDEATGLPSHALLLRQIIPALARCRREGLPAVMLVAGIDGLAEIRARRGPAQAGEMLRGLATVLGDATRAGDLSGHVQADVLGTLLPAASGETGERVAARLRAFASDRMVNPEMSGRRLTVSVGIAVVGEGTEPAALEEAMSAALAAYREAAAAGGDRERLAPSPPARSLSGAA